MTSLTRTARLTGLAYLGLAVSGMLGFLLIRQQLFAADDAAATAANLIGHEGLARLGIAGDLTIVLTQALAALGFFALFRRSHVVAAVAIAAFGLVNAVSILVATALTATALEVALGSSSDSAATAQLLYELSDSVWSVGSLFFGLWLIPMGLAVWRSGLMPRLLGWVLVVGGVGYIVSAYAGYLLPGVPMLADVLVVPATVGELWMVTYLLWRGVRPEVSRRSVPALQPAA